MTTKPSKKAAATITGNVGWESVLRGKKAIVFGVPWYRDCTGVCKVESVEDCRKVIEEVQKDATVSEGDLLAYLKALDEVGVRAHLGVSGSVWPAISDAESMRVVSGKILQMLAKVR